MPVFEIENLKFSYDKYNDATKNALNGISFKVQEKDFIALIGESGSGKSTLISHLNGLYKADSGDILYRGESIYSKDFNLTNLRFKCGIVFQYPDYQLFSETVLDDVCFGAIKKGLSLEEAKTRSLEILKMLGIEDLKDEIPFNLSGGEKRKVAFAGIFVMDPDVLIFDEPDAGLDSISRKHFYDLIKKLNEDYNKTIIVITHNLDDVVEYANRVLILKNGNIIADGTPLEVFSNKTIMKDSNLVMPYAFEIQNKVLECGYSINKNNVKFNDLLETLVRL